MIVDDHTLIREGLASLLQKDSRIEVVAEASSAEEALRLIEQIECDVAVVDLSLPQQDGVWCTKMMRQVRPGLGILILSMHRDEARLRAALEAGARGYIVKSARREEIVNAVYTVYDGNSYLHHSVASMVLASTATRPKTETFSEREVKVLDGVAAGHSNKEIADHLFVSVAMVKKHLQSLYRKFDVDDRTQLAMEALQRGIIEPRK
ncbi:MAG TPA: response regulator transcription factor [Candidatus Xenobia bacterium]|jgi:DNA-binding NarL/FixJ family response regulator